MQKPAITRTYLNHHLDSSRWDCYSPRRDDIIVTTSYKSGTTLTQQILYNLLVAPDKLPPVDAASPWVDARFHRESKTELAELLEQLPGRRFLKSHLPLDGLPYYPEVKYLIVGRDPRDVFMSLANHYENYTDLAYRQLETGNPGTPLPRYPGDIKVLWRNWITRGWFDWETEGYPFWSNLHHTQSYWVYRALPNFLFVHYSNLRQDLAREVQRIASFIRHPLQTSELDRLVERVSFESVKQAAEKETEREARSERFFAGGSTAFIYKGTNGRWREVLDEADLALYEHTRNQVLDPACANWLETGNYPA